MSDISTSTSGSRLDCLYVATATTGLVATGAAVCPLIDTLNPSSDVLSFSSIEVDLSGVALGSRITLKWLGRPIFIDHRAEVRIALARTEDNNANLIDPATDAECAQRAEWLVVIGVCHGSVYDAAGRVRRGPAPRNLDLPPYTFTSDTMRKSDNPAASCGPPDSGAVSRPCYRHWPSSNGGAGGACPRPACHKTQAP